MFSDLDTFVNGEILAFFIFAITKYIKEDTLSSIFFFSKNVLDISSKIFPLPTIS